MCSLAEERRLDREADRRGRYSDEIREEKARRREGRLARHETADQALAELAAEVLGVAS